jgi:poly(3-hydroxybutyrate) depolymerase
MRGNAEASIAFPGGRVMGLLKVRWCPRWAAALFLLALYGCGGTSQEGAPADKAGRVEHYVYGPAPEGVNNGVPYTYQVYVPERYQPDQLKPWPLFVMVHGCGTTADQQMGANLINDVAAAEDFLVMYPDNGGNCWRSVSGSGTRGDGGDQDQLAGMTVATMEQYRVDPERVYIIGMSSGAFGATDTVMNYPELYAAAGVMAGGGYGMNVTCIAMPDAVAPVYAQQAVEHMGSGARIIPFIALGGTQDQLGEFPVDGCSRKAFLEAMAFNNILRGGLPVGETTTGGRYALDPDSTVTGQVPDGYAWTQEVWRDTAGCEIGERWIIEGMGHYWSGGSKDPKYWDTQPNGAAGFNDPKGPSASQAAWDFFRRFRKSDTGNECAESQPWTKSS